MWTWAQGRANSISIMSRNFLSMIVKRFPNFLNNFFRHYQLTEFIWLWKFIYRYSNSNKKHNPSQ
jgi:hypothetical protein